MQTRGKRTLTEVHLPEETKVVNEMQKTASERKRIIPAVVLESANPL
jgi:hypothetical protein